MTPDELIAAFDVVAEAPDGVARLRELVLQLAVRGKLVAQDPTDGQASSLLEQAAKELAQLRTSGRGRQAIRRPASMGTGAPRGWACVTLGEVAFIAMGNSPPGTSYNYSGIGVPLVNGPVEFSKGPFGPTIQSKFTDAPTQMCEAGDLLVCVRGATTGRTNIAAFQACIGRGVALVRAWDAQPFVNLFMWHIGQELLRAGKGTTFPSISSADIAQKPFSVPPLAEQHRIVARVDELMGLLNRLEAARTTREGTRVAVRDSALDALCAADTPTAVAVAWKRLATRVEAVLYDLTDFAPLRRALIDLAVHGRLVAQDPADEAASLQLARIMSERARPARVGGSAAVAPPPLPSKTETPFELPNGWTWCRFGDLLVDGPTNGWSPTAVAHDTGVRTLKLSATTSGVFDGRHFKFVEAKLQPDSPLWLEPGDLLIQRSNTPEYVGMAAVYRGPPHAFIYPDLMMRCRLSSATSIEFVHTALLSPASRAWFSERASGTSQSMVKLNQGTVRATLLPLPPIAEQHRIVSRLAELMDLVDRLQARIAATDTAHLAFATAAIHDLVT